MTLEPAGLAAGPCQLHRFHAPKNRTVEWHHVIPVAWQLHTTLTTPPPYPGQDPDGRGMLWDSRGIWLCPTGHRNVHYWIVELMHAAATAGTDDPAAAQAAVVKASKLRPSALPAELPIAVEALTRYLPESGASLLALTAAGEWGQS